MDEKIIKAMEERYNVSNLEMFLKEVLTIKRDISNSPRGFISYNVYKYYPCVSFYFNGLNYEFSNFNELNNNNSIGLKEIGELEAFIKITTFKDNLDNKLIDKIDKLKRIKI